MNDNHPLTYDTYDWDDTEYNVLFLIGGYQNKTILAVVPAKQLGHIDLAKINNKTVNHDADAKDAFNIVELYNRFGLNEATNADLKKYLNPEPPFMVHAVIHINWIM